MYSGKKFFLLQFSWIYLRFPCVGQGPLQILNSLQEEQKLEFWQEFQAPKVCWDEVSAHLGSLVQSWMAAVELIFFWNELARRILDYALSWTDSILHLRS